jgi:hypothetical protein
MKKTYSKMAAASFSKFFTSTLTLRNIDWSASGELLRRGGFSTTEKSQNPKFGKSEEPASNLGTTPDRHDQHNNKIYVKKHQRERPHF